MSVYTRKRSRGGFSSAEVRKYSNSPSGSAPSDTVFWTEPGRIGESESIWDNPHPGYRKRASRGEIIMGELLLSSVSVKCSNGHFQLGPLDDWGVSELSGDLAAMGGTLLDRGEIDAAGLRALDIAVNKAYAKVYGSPVLIGEFANDFKQTISMLRKPFSSATKLIADIASSKRRRLRLSSGRNALKAASDAWLEYRYGWKPLILDCQTTIDQVSKIHQKYTRKHLVARSSESTSVSRTKDFQGTGFGSWPNLSSYGQATGKGFATANAGVMYTVSNPVDPGEAASRIFGTSARDVPATVWEIIPFSFVVDWFVGVGDWIQASVPNPSVSVLTSWGTRVVDWGTSCAPEFYYPAGLSPHHTAPTTAKVGELEKHEHYVIRNIGLSPSSTPPLKFNGLSMVQTTDALSLLSQQLLTGLKGLRH